MYYTTLCKIRGKDPCSNGWAKLLRSLGKTRCDNEPLSICTILSSNGICDAIWALRAMDNPICNRDARLFAIRCVRHVQHLIHEPELLDALDVAERYAVGMATVNDLQVAEMSIRDIFNKNRYVHPASFEAEACISLLTKRWVPFFNPMPTVLHAANAFVYSLDKGKEMSEEEHRDVKSAAWKMIENEFRDIFCS